MYNASEVLLIMYGIWNKPLQRWATIWETGTSMGFPQLDCVILVSPDKSKLDQLHSALLRPYDLFEVRPFTRENER